MAASLGLSIEAQRLGALAAEHAALRQRAERVRAVAAPTDEPGPLDLRGAGAPT